MDAPWTRSVEDILQHYNVDPTRGLTAAAAEKHAELYGKNGMYTCTLLAVGYS